MPTITDRQALAKLAAQMCGRPMLVNPGDKGNLNGQTLELVHTSLKTIDTCQAGKWVRRGPVPKQAPLADANTPVRPPVQLGEDLPTVTIPLPPPLQVGEDFPTVTIPGGPAPAGGTVTIPTGTTPNGKIKRPSPPPKTSAITVKQT